MTASTHTSEFRVTGMTCANCERHVRAEVETLPGVYSVEISKDSGLLRITSSEELSDDEVLAAVDEAGYAAARLR